MPFEYLKRFIFFSYSEKCVGKLGWTEVLFYLFIVCVGTQELLLPDSYNTSPKDEHAMNNFFFTTLQGLLRWVHMFLPVPPYNISRIKA